jgi:hypothetical protein
MNAVLSARTESDFSETFLGKRRIIGLFIPIFLSSCLGILQVPVVRRTTVTGLNHVVDARRKTATRGFFGGGGGGG